MLFTMNLKGQVNQMRLPKSKSLWPLFETIVNAIQSLEDTKNCEKPLITIKANRIEGNQLNIKGKEELNHFEEFIVTDNGEGFTERNYQSFLEGYSTLKIAKGCKGIGRFLWLKAFDQVTIQSIYSEDNIFYERKFDFTLEHAIEPEVNRRKINEQKCITEIRLSGFHEKYRETVALSLESLAKKIIEHCLPYFIIDGCPEIILQDNMDQKINLNQYYRKLYKNTLHRDEIIIEDNKFLLYHMTVNEGADKHELHLCANNREVKSYELSKYIPNLDKKIITEIQSYYYVGYIVGEYLDNSVSAERYEFNFSEAPILKTIDEKDLITAAIVYISSYLSEDLGKIKDEKQ